MITHARHRAHLENALEFLEAFLETRECSSRYSAALLSICPGQHRRTLSSRQKSSATPLRPSARYLVSSTWRTSWMPFFETSALASSKVYYHSVVIRSQAVIGNHAFIVRVDSETRFYCDIWGDGIYRTATRVGYVCMYTKWSKMEGIECCRGT